MSKIAEASQRTNGLIEDLLHLAQVTRGELERRNLDLAPIAQEIIDSLCSASPQRNVAVSIPARLSVFGDPGLLRIVLENLISNAWKFTSQRPDAAIEVGMHPGSKPIYFVRDNGAGFDMRYINRLFAPFERLHDQAQFPGTGVGLTTVQRIVHKHGGEIWAESEVGRGATFYFSVPAACRCACGAFETLGRH